MSIGIAPGRSEMDGVSAAAAELDRLMLLSTTAAAEYRAARLRVARMTVLLMLASRCLDWMGLNVLPVTPAEMIELL